jgi:phage/plasmid-like protein (TIGR03299 family)
MANILWRVAKKPLTYIWNEQSKESDQVWAIVREDNGAQLGFTGPDYQCIQNEDGFEFLDSVLDSYGAKYSSAGAVYGGRQVWMTVDLPEQRFQVNGKDSVEPHAVFFLDHSGRRADKCFPTMDRPECANTVRVALDRARGKGLTLRHSGNIKSKIQDAKEALGLAVKGMETFKQQADVMSHTRVDIQHYANDVLDAVLEVTQADCLKGADALAAALQVTEANRELAAKSFAKKIERRGEILDDILTRYESRTNGVNGMRGTTWAGYNAITEYANHNTIGRQVGTVQERASRRFESILMGDADDLQQIALEKAVAM